MATSKFGPGTNQEERVTGARIGELAAGPGACEPPGQPKELETVKLIITNPLMEFAAAVVYGTAQADKLRRPPPLSVAEQEDAGLVAALELQAVPVLPGRPLQWSKPGKAAFPALARLNEAQVRGQVLHFFANHELMALELMALALLRFPEAPASFRWGLAQTIAQEQDHMCLYLERMSELGVQFGDLPLNNYFWNAMRGMASPLQFVTMMGLTVEQANLDFAAFYSRAMTAVGDGQTAALLDRIYREEIGHVAHGLVWFNRWRAADANAAQFAKRQAESEWQAYLRLLPPPMTAARAKGFEFTAQARREAGLSEDYIRELALFGGSKGRPPIVWLFNPHCDAEIARGKPGGTPSQGAQRLERDLGLLPAFLALDQDVVWTAHPPRSAWVESLQHAGFAIPEFSQSVAAPKIGGFEPWGWSPSTFAKAAGLVSRLTRTSGGNAEWCQGLVAQGSFASSGLGAVFSKAWSVRWLQNWLNLNPDAFPGALATCGTVLSDLQSTRARIAELLAKGGRAMVKAPLGTAGMQVRQVVDIAELDGQLGGWISKVLASQGEIVVEPCLDRTADLSIQLQVEPQRTRLFDVRSFLTDPQHHYRGALLGGLGLEAEGRQLVHQLLPAWRKLGRDVAASLRAHGYSGPAGIDALLYRQGEALRLKPLVEINPRWTMGRVAWALEQRLAPAVPARWLFLPVRQILQAGHADPLEFATELQRQHPVVKSASGRLRRGVVFTNDPATAQEVLTVLATSPNPQLEALVPNLNANRSERA